MRLDPESRPQLRAGCRFSDRPGQEQVLLIPEGLMNLAGPGRKILELCDGKRTLTEVVAELQSIYPAAPLDQIERDTATYLERLCDRGVVEF